MAQYLKFPKDNPSIWDFPNFKTAWLSETDWVAYMNHLLETGDPMAKTFNQYPSRTFVIFVPIDISGHQHPLGHHLVSFFVEVKGDVVSIKTKKIYRHGFIPHEIYEDILEGLVEWTDFLSETNNEMIDEIMTNQNKMGPVIPFPLVDSYGELMETIQKWFENVSSK